MRFGLALGPHNLPADANHWDTTRAMAEAAEEAGFDSLWMNDHFVFYAPDRPEAVFPWLEGFLGLGALAAVTKRVRLGALVAGVPYRNPALLAKMYTTLDVMSHGRCIIGLGAGWHKQEFDAYGWPFPSAKERLDMLEEATQIIKRMMTERPANFVGSHFAIHDALNDPPPIQRPHPPIMIGGGGEKRTLRLVAQYADFCNVSGSVEEVARKFAVLRDHCREVGRPYEEITPSIDFLCVIGRDEADVEATRERYADFGGVVGTPEMLIEVLREYQAVGAQYATVAMADAAQLEPIRIFAQTVLPALADD